MATIRNTARADAAHTARCQLATEHRAADTLRALGLTGSDWRFCQSEIARLTALIARLEDAGHD